MIRTLPALLVLAACSPKPGDAAAGGRHYDYKVQLMLTPGASAKLKGMGEKVIVSNLYYGIAKAGTAAAARAETLGQVTLADNPVEVDAVDQIVSVSVAPLDAARLKELEGEEPLLLINVYSARKAHADNLINCGIFDDKLAKAEEATIPIHCDLINPDPPPPPVEVVPPTDEN